MEQTHKRAVLLLYLQYRLMYQGFFEKKEKQELVSNCAAAQCFPYNIFK